METSSLPAFLIGCLTVDDCYLHIGADVVMDREPKVTTYFDQNYGGPVGASLNHILPKTERGTRIKRSTRGGAEENQTQLVKRKITLITKIYINYKGRSSSYQGKVWRASLEL